MARECLAAGAERRAMGEVVAAAVSRLNTCPYCLDIHSSMLHSLGRPAVAEAQAITEWAEATLTPEAGILANPPFSPNEAPQMIGAAICFHYLNRVTNVFLEPAPFLIGGDGWIKKSAIRMAGNFLRPRLANQIVAPGQFLNEASEAPLPSEFAWAAANPQVAGGVRRFISAAEEAGIESVGPQVRECVGEYVQAWRGEAPDLGQAWLEKAVGALDEEHRPAARLALVTALASYRVDEQLVSGFRLQKSSDRDLINLTSWASYIAARRIASWTGRVK